MSTKPLNAPVLINGVPVDSQGQPLSFTEEYHISGKDGPFRLVELEVSSKTADFTFHHVHNMFLNVSMYTPDGKWPTFVRRYDHLYENVMLKADKLSDGQLRLERDAMEIVALIADQYDADEFVCNYEGTSLKPGWAFYVDDPVAPQINLKSGFEHVLGWMFRGRLIKSGQFSREDLKKFLAP